MPANRKRSNEPLEATHRTPAPARHRRAARARPRVHRRRLRRLQHGTAAQAEADPTSQETIEEGKKLFQANCATCHGLEAQGTGTGPSLIGVGAAAVDFQVGTGRMPMQMQGPQAQEKPAQFTDEQIKQLAYYVASLGPGPDIPADSLVNGGGDAANGAELFRINCAMCHNVAGAGGALTEGKFAPPLTDVSGVHIYEAMVTGPQNMPVFNDLNITPEDKRDIITYLQVRAGQPFARRFRARLARSGRGGPVHLDLRSRRHRRDHRVDHGEVQLAQPGTEEAKKENHGTGRPQRHRARRCRLVARRALARRLDRHRPHPDRRVREPRLRAPPPSRHR